MKAQVWLFQQTDSSVRNQGVPAHGTEETSYYRGEVELGESGFIHLVDEGDYLSPGTPCRIEVIEDGQDVI